MLCYVLHTAQLHQVDAMGCSRVPPPAAKLSSNHKNCLEHPGNVFFEISSKETGTSRWLRVAGLRIHEQLCYLSEALLQGSEAHSSSFVIRERFRPHSSGIFRVARSPPHTCNHNAIVSHDSKNRCSEISPRFLQQAFDALRRDSRPEL